MASRHALLLLAVSAACDNSSDRPADPLGEPLADAAAPDAAAHDAAARDAQGSLLADAGADASSRADSASDAQVDGSSAQMKGVLQLPMVPVPSATLQNPAIIVSTPTPKIVIEAPLGFAIGEGYPSEFLGSFSDAYWAGCGSLQGTFRFDRLEGNTSEVSAELAGSSGVRFKIAAPGKPVITLLGSYSPRAGEPCAESLMGLSSIPVEMQFKVFAARPAGVRVTHGPRCSDGAPLLVATSSRPQLDAQLIDQDGAPMYAINALTHRQASLTLEASEQVTWTLPSEVDGLFALQWPSVAGSVRIVPALGDPSLVTVVDAPSISDVDVEFVLGGYVGQPFTLEDGVSVGADGWRRVSNRLVPTIVTTHVGANVLCSEPNPAWFSLHSATPSRCDVRPVSDGSLESAVQLPRASLGLSSYVAADGVCSLHLRAEHFASGKGFEASLSVTLAGVEGLHKVP